jgi:hypothetical protein
MYRDDARHFVAGNRGVSEWLFTGTTAEGKTVEVNGCDVLTFEGDRIALRSSYFKTSMQRITLLALAGPRRYTDEPCTVGWW